jgi:hypothetical protein
MRDNLLNYHALSTNVISILFITCAGLLLSSCCGEKTLKFIDINIVVYDPLDMSYTDTLDTNSEIILPYQSQITANCDCSRCIDEKYTNEILEDSYQVMVDKDVVIESILIPPGTDLFHHGLTKDLINSTFESDQATITFDNKLIMGIPEGLITLNITTSTSDGLELETNGQLIVIH